MNTPDLKAWIGRREVRRDSAAPNQAMAMAATLDLDPDAFRTGATLPEFWHWIYFTHPIRRSRLGEDGHELRGDFMPPVDLPRRMWAGGRVRFLRPIVIGASIERASEIISIDEKHGRSGPLVLTTVRHIISDPGGPCVEEEQDIVYCEIPRSDELSRRQATLPADVHWRETFLPDAVTLFRYSALMFNAHRIHFDYPFTTEVEGYRGLLVHGPLTATLLLEAAKRNVQRVLVSFRYRGLAPLFNDELITLAGRNTKHEDETELWAADLNGLIAMQGAVSWRK